MTGPLAEPTVLITPEKIALILRVDLATYAGRQERAAMRAALGDAAGICDVLASELIAQNTRRGRITRRVAAMAANFKRCGDEIWRMRDAVLVDARAASEAQPQREVGE